jgi:hypothetical protein
MKMCHVKVPAARFFNVGESEEMAAWHRYNYRDRYCRRLRTVRDEETCGFGWVWVGDAETGDWVWEEIGQSAGQERA